MEPEEWVAGNSFGDQCRVTPVGVFLIRKIGVGELYGSGKDHQYRFGPSASTTMYLSLPSFVHDVFLVAVNANVFKFTLRPPDGFSMQFLESSPLHGIADNRYPCRVPALTRFRTCFRVVRRIYSKPVTSWNLAIEKMRFWYESSA